MLYNDVDSGQGFNGAGAVTRKIAIWARVTELLGQ